MLTQKSVSDDCDVNFPIAANPGEKVVLIVKKTEAERFAEPMFEIKAEFPGGFLAGGKLVGDHAAKLQGGMGRFEPEQQQPE